MMLAPKVKTRKEAVQSLSHLLASEFWGINYDTISHHAKQHIDKKAKVILEHIDSEIISLGELEEERCDA